MTLDIWGSEYDPFAFSADDEPMGIMVVKKLQKASVTHTKTGETL